LRMVPVVKVGSKTDLHWWQSKLFKMLRTAILVS